MNLMKEKLKKLLIRGNCQFKSNKIQICRNVSRSLINETEKKNSN